MYKIRRLNGCDRKLGEAISESLKTAYDPAISKFLAHQDEGYKTFFLSNLDNSSYATYYSYNILTDELAGFACFEIIDNVLFLKHIVVNNRLRGNKIGTKLLDYAVRDLQERHQYMFEFFELHVFEKNSRALDWYLNIGMEIADCIYWYDLSSNYNHLKVNEYSERDIDVCRDKFGFIQLKYRNTFLGTLLAKKVLIIKNSAALNYQEQLIPFLSKNKIKSVGFISNELYDFKLIDKTFLMRTPIRTLHLDIIA